MDDQHSVIAFPTHRRGSLADTLTGFPDRPGTTWSTRRAERRLTMLIAEIRGWKPVADRIGGPSADMILDASMSAAVEAVRASGGTEIAVSGDPRQPVLSATFAGDGHAARALVAGTALRDAADAVRSAEGLGLRGCVGLDTGTVIDTRLGGAFPVAYRAMGTVRMFAVRLQEFAGPGQVFASAGTVAEIPDGLARFRSIGEVRTNPGGETAEAFSLTEPAAAREVPAALGPVALAPVASAPAPAAGTATAR